MALRKISVMAGGGCVACGAAESTGRQIAQINKCPKRNTRKLHFLCETSFKFFNQLKGNSINNSDFCKRS